MRSVSYVIVVGLISVLVMSSFVGAMADHGDASEEDMDPGIDDVKMEESLVTSRHSKEERADTDSNSLDSNSEDQWRWLYDHAHRTETNNAIGANTDTTWHGGMRIDLSDDIGSIITEVAYYNMGQDADSVQAHVAEEAGGAPGNWLASSDVYVPDGDGWVELGLNEPVEIESPGEYWIVLEIDDKGENYFPFGCISPHVIDGQYMAFDDPHVPENWDDLKDDRIGGAWSLEARVENVGTLPATNISSSTVTLNGDLRGDPADVFFKYRERGSSAWSETTPTHEETGKFSHIVRGLSNLTEYEFKAVAEFEHEGQLVEVEGDPLVFMPGYVSRTTQIKEEWEQYDAFGDNLRIEDDALGLDTKMEWTETYEYGGETGDGPSETVDVSNTAEIEVQMSGAGGGGDMWTEGAGGYAGGDGGYVEATLDVSDFDQIDIWVGERGEGGEEFVQASGGWGKASGGGGYLEADNASTGAGGGSTEIWASDGTPLAATDAGGGGGSYYEFIGYLEYGGGGGARAGTGGTGDDGVGEDADPADPEWDSNGYGGDGGDYANNLEGGLGGGEVNSDYLVGEPQIDIGEGKPGGGPDGQPGTNATVQVTYREYYEESSRRCEPLSLEGVDNVEDSLIVWESNEPQGTSIDIYTAVTDNPEQTPGDWDLATNGDSIPDIGEGDNLTDKYLWVRQDFSTTDFTVTPELHDISVAVEQSGVERFDLTINDPEPQTGNGTTDPSPGTYSLFDEGYEVPVQAIPEGNWTFSHWMGDYPDGQQEQEEITIVMDDDKDITPYFEDVDTEVEYNLTISIEGTGTTDPAEGNHTFSSGEAVPVKADPAEGHVFSEWTGDVPAGGEEEEEITLIMDENKSITAHFIEMFELTVHIDGEGNVTDHEDFEFQDGDTKDYVYGTEVTLTAEADKHWYLEEWTGDNETGTEDTINITMDWDKEITAVFAEKDYTLTVNIEGGGTVEDHEEFEFQDGDTKDYTQMTDVTLSAVADEHWYLEEWTGDYEGTEEQITITMDGNKTITAVFEEHRYTLDVTTDGQGSVNIEPDKEEYEPTEQVTLTAEPAEHWDFVEWTGDYEGEEEEITITMDEDKSITALFEIHQRNLTIDINGDGRTEPEEGTHTYDHGEDITVEAIEDYLGWYFSHWEGDVPEGEEDQQEIIITMESDRSITAVFQIQEYDLTIDIDGEGSLSDLKEG
ncbi:MAG: hypothetical protein V5A88_04630, partial [Candidatus Thermoplasmatota archaeon]